MTRVLSTVRNDIIVQFRNNLYNIGIFVALLVGVILAYIARPDTMFRMVPTLIMLAIGGTTLLYVAAMIVFERDEGTLNALIVSPLRTSEYLGSKIATLTILATIESVIMIGIAMAIMSFSNGWSFPNIPILLIGIVAIAIIYTLIGILLIVRYDKITDFLMPMAFFAVLLQLPFLHFLDIVNSPLFLLIPTSAPTVLMRGAYITLTPAEWAYGILYTAFLIVTLSILAHRAFEKHVIQKVG